MASTHYSNHRFLEHYSNSIISCAEESRHDHHGPFCSLFNPILWLIELPIPFSLSGALPTKSLRPPRPPNTHSLSSKQTRSHTFVHIFVCSKQQTRFHGFQISSVKETSKTSTKSVSICSPEKKTTSSNIQPPHVFGMAFPPFLQSVVPPFLPPYAGQALPTGDFGPPLRRWGGRLPGFGFGAHRLASAGMQCSKRLGAEE